MLRAPRGETLPWSEQAIGPLCSDSKPSTYIINIISLESVSHFCDVSFLSPCLVFKCCVGLFLACKVILMRLKIVVVERESKQKPQIQCLMCRVCSDFWGYGRFSSQGAQLKLEAEVDPKVSLFLLLDFPLFLP